MANAGGAGDRCRVALFIQHILWFMTFLSLVRDEGRADTGKPHCNLTRLWHPSRPSEPRLAQASLDLQSHTQWVRLGTLTDWKRTLCLMAELPVSPLQVPVWAASGGGGHLAPPRGEGVRIAFTGQAGSAQRHHPLGLSLSIGL